MCATVFLCCCVLFGQLLIRVVLALVLVTTRVWRPTGDSIDHRRFQASFLGLIAANSDVKQLGHYIEWTPERTRSRICLTHVSCQLNIPKMTPKPDLSDDMLDAWDEAGPREMDTEGDVTLESWTVIFT